MKLVLFLLTLITLVSVYIIRHIRVRCPECGSIHVRLIFADLDNEVDHYLCIPCNKEFKIRK